MNFSELLVTLVDYAWGMPLVVLLIGGGLYLIFVSRLQCLTGFLHAIKLITGKFHHPNDDNAPGQISHFKALTNALSATVGMGNIAGVAVAISQGGPGAIFWMWVAAIVGMNTKFFECTLAVMFRGRDHRGQVQGGPMYVIEKALPKNLRPLAYAFGVFGLIGTMALFNANQLSTYMSTNYQIPPLATGILVGIGVGYILMGGVVRIGNFTSFLVPFMCALYVLGSLGVILVHIDQVPGIIGDIFAQAFSGRAAGGGVTGLSVAYILRTGVKRAAFSNEAGVGTAPMAHGNAHTAEPIAEGLVAMVGPFIDTIIVCTMTALVILIGVPNYWEAGEGVLMTQQAFEGIYGSFGTHFLGVAVILFSFSTIVGMANYNKKCFDFVFKGYSVLGRRETFVAIFIITVIWGTLGNLDDIVNLLDLGYGLMAWPNMIATIILAPKVKKAMDEYFEKYSIRKKSS